MGMANLQKMAQQMQQEMLRVQTELESTIVDGSVFVVIASRLPSCWPTRVTPSICTGPAPTVSALSFQ